MAMSVWCGLGAEKHQIAPTRWLVASVDGGYESLLSQRNQSSLGPKQQSRSFEEW